MRAAQVISPIDTLKTSLARRTIVEKPYRHWLLYNVLPDDIIEQLANVPLNVVELEGTSGKRELHNNARTYLDANNTARFMVCRVVAELFQSPDTVRAFTQAFDTPLDGTYLRLEYAQDVDGFWLEPHTDLGVKAFTMLIYLPGGDQQSGIDQHDLGTDIYADAHTHVGRPPFIPNTALVFIPSQNTWHGFEKRPISGIRKSLIVNYVTPEWRAREQLAYPEQPVRAG